MSHKPDIFFNVTVHPKYYVFGCSVKQDQESRGLFGFHLFSSCPACKVQFAGWELWGENGHMQGSVTQFGDSAPTRQRLAVMLKYMAGRHVWLKNQAKWQGIRFRVGSPLYYVGHCA